MKKNRKDIFLKLILHPAVLAIPFALITIFLLPVRFSKVELVPAHSYAADKSGKQTTQYYHDLNNDTVDEEISHFVTDIGQCAIKIRNTDKSYKGQWNFNGSLPSGCRNLLFLDVSGDGVLDVFTLYQRQDSLFLGGVDTEVDSVKLLEDVFVDKIKVVNGNTDFIAQLYHNDLNLDGNDEILINIIAGYSEQPRRIYAYDYINKTIEISPVVGFKNTCIKFFDLDGDGYPELLPSTVSNENIESNLGIPFHDYDRWFVVYDHKLNFKFGPKNMGGGNGALNSFIFKNDTAWKVVLVDNNNDSSKKINFFVFDWKSKEIQKINLDTDPFVNQFVFKSTTDGNEYLALYDNQKGQLNIYDPFRDFIITGRYVLEPESGKLKDIDVNGDGANEYVFYKEKEGKEFLYVYSNTFQNLFQYEIPVQVSTIHQIATRIRPDKKTYFVLQLDEKLIEFSYASDQWYWLKNLALYFIVYGFYVLLIAIILYYQKKILQASFKRDQELAQLKLKSFVRDQQLAELKLKSIRNQLDPHFTFNAINAVASAIMKEDKETAYAYFSLFSQLMRSTMLYSDKMTRMLDEELKYTKQYLDIEKFRFREKFVYDIHVEREVNTGMEVPRMIIQTFAESAVSNGLMHRATDGVLKISLKIEKNRLIILFSDNGVGIEKSNRLNKAKAFKALHIMDEFIRIFNELNQTDITYKIYDLDGSEEFPGTEVRVSLPLVFKYNPGN